MKTKSNIEIANLWFEAFIEHNLEKLLSLYAVNAKHFSPKLKIRQPETMGLIQGKDKLRIWWQDSFDRLPSLSYFPTNFIADDNQVFMEYIRKVYGEEDTFIGEVLEIENNLILASRVYQS